MLDDEKRISQIDVAHMLQGLVQFPEQIKAALQIMDAAKIPDFIKINNVVISGMGASGISGDIVESLFRDKIDVPIVVNKEYELPRWANKHTLAIVLSYSGNTEETLSSFKSATQKKCKIIGVSSGGKLKEYCEARGITFITIPSSFQPRAATAFLLFPLLYILKRNKLIPDSIDEDIQETLAVTEEFRTRNNVSVPESENQAKQLAQKLFNTIPQIYGWGVYTPIAKRWRHQFNENSKLIARDDIVSECNHNDLVGWSANPEISKQFSCIIFRDKTEESVYISARLDFMKTLFEGVAKQVIEVSPKGKSRLAKQMYMMCLGDITSCYLAILRNIDPSPVEVIAALKNRLAEI
ncbi:MAG: bifunctional phosphoglucose/phosphomannose isomerase [Euryarchaeota archaeon]|nr:bifunctional phosphoglucose/phosphomannose isomerase [Euryarchaeota archaeon]